MNKPSIFESKTEPEELCQAMGQAFKALALSGKKAFGSLNLLPGEFDMKCEIYVRSVCDLAAESRGTIFEWEVSAELLLRAAKQISADPNILEIPDCSLFALICKRVIESQTKVISREVVRNGVTVLAGQRVPMSLTSDQCEQILDSIAPKPKAIEFRKPQKGDPTLAMVAKIMKSEVVVRETEQSIHERKELLRRQAREA